MSDPQVKYAVVEYLHSLLPSYADSDKESLEVAIQCLTELFQVNPTDPEQKKKLSLGVSLPNLIQGHLSPAAPASTQEKKKEVSEADKQKAEELKNAGNKEMAAKDYEASIEKYTEALALWPDNAIYYANRAAAYSCVRKFEEAVQDCNMAVSKDPKYSKAYSRLGLAQFQLKKYEESVEAYKEAMKLEPENTKFAADLKLAQEKLDSVNSEAMREDQPTGAGSSNAQGGRPGGMPGGFGGGAPGGGMDMGGLFGMLNNPNLMNMAAQMMSNPNIQRMMQDPNISRMAQSMMAGGGTPDIQSMMQDPNIVNVAQQLASENPDLVDQVRGMTSQPGEQQRRTEDIDE